MNCICLHTRANCSILFDKRQKSDPPVQMWQIYKCFIREKLFECATCHITVVIYSDLIDVSNHPLLSTSHQWFSCSLRTIIRKQNSSYVMQDDYHLYLSEKTRSSYHLQMCNKGNTLYSITWFQKNLRLGQARSALSLVCNRLTFIVCWNGSLLAVCNARHPLTLDSPEGQLACALKYFKTYFTWLLAKAPLMISYSFM